MKKMTVLASALCAAMGATSVQAEQMMVFEANVTQDLSWYNPMGWFGKEKELARAVGSGLAGQSIPLQVFKRMSYPVAISEAVTDGESNILVSTNNFEEGLDMRIKANTVVSEQGERVEVFTNFVYKMAEETGAGVYRENNVKAVHSWVIEPSEVQKIPFMVGDERFSLNVTVHPKKSDSENVAAL